MSYPPTWRISQRLVRIAECQRLFRHAGILPDDSTTLSKLVSLTDERYQELLDNGTIHPNMGRNDMAGQGRSGLAGARSRPRWHSGVIRPEIASCWASAGAWAGRVSSGAKPAAMPRPKVESTSTAGWVTILANGEMLSGKPRTKK